MATATTTIQQITVASTRVATDPRGRAAGAKNIGAWSATSAGRIRRIADGASTGGGGTSPRTPAGATAGEGAAGTGCGDVGRNSGGAWCHTVTCGAPSRGAPV